MHASSCLTAAVFTVLLVSANGIQTAAADSARPLDFSTQAHTRSLEIGREGLDVPGHVWLTYAGSRKRLFFNPQERWLTRDTVGQLRERWRFPTGAVITASPSVALINVPGEGRIQVVYFASWDGHVYAVRLEDGSELWRFAADDQPGASFPAAASATVRDQRVYIGWGETMYALDARTGEALWRFAAGTGCRDENGNPPGLCGFDNERNQIESSALVADGKIFFGMDVNDVATGKGGFYAVHATDGRLAWFFDLESGQTCRPFPHDTIHRFDGYHSTEELGLPADFFATRPGCDFPRSRNGCGNVWSSAAFDRKRGLLFFASSNCDTDDDPNTPVPPPPMPPYDEAIVALSLGGVPAWRWRPREVDNDDLAFGAAPNLFRIQVGPKQRDVVGVGNKDGTYYVLDRDGINELSGERWDDPDASALPYWSRQVVPGGAVGGIVATAAVDEQARQLYVSTAPGFDPLEPQQPTVHALTLDTGAVVWESGFGPPPEGDASFAPTSAVTGVVFVGSVQTPTLRAYDAATGDLLFQRLIGDQIVLSAVASAPVVIDGTLLVGTGIGTRTGDPTNPSDIAAHIPSSLVALCVPGANPAIGSFTPVRN